ncbi:MAG: hypothetical protein V4558_01275 [Gemmatimonadota bacterium]
MVPSRRNSVVTLVVVLGALFVPARAVSQAAPDTVAAWARWLGTAPALRALTDASVATALLPTNRRGDATLKQPRILAAVLDTAASLSYGWAYRNPWGGFALARALQAERGSCGPIDGVNTREFLDWCRRTYEAYLGSFDRDSAFAPTIADLDLIVPYPRVWATAQRELAGVNGALVRGGLPAAVQRQLERLRLQLSLEQGDAGEGHALITRAGPQVLTSGERNYLLAFVEANAGSAREATRLYAAASADSGGGEHQQWVARDLALVGGSSDSAAFVALPFSERARWVEGFWLDRDFEDGHFAGARFAEHARRWRVVLQHYRVADRDELLRKLPADRTAVLAACKEQGNTADGGAPTPFCSLGGLDLRGRLLDDRGLTYLRHGEPPARANYPGTQASGTESWLYTLRERPALAHFARLDRVLSGMFATSLSTGDWMATCQLAAFYCVLEARKSLKSLSQERIVRVKELAAQDQAFLASHDGAPSRFDNKLRLAASAVGLGRQPGMLTAALDISLRDLTRYGAEDSSHLSLRWQLRVRNAAKEWVVSIDTMRHFRLPALGNGSNLDGYLTALLEVPLPGGAYEVKMIVSDSAGRVGAEYSHSGLVIGDPDAPMDISDLVLLPDGEQGAPTAIEGNPVRLSPALSPGRAKFVGLGYILSGAAGRDVPLTVTVTQVGKDGVAPAVTVRFVDRPPTARAFRTQRVGIGSLKSGSYELRVTAELSPTVKVERTQRLVVP